MFRVFKVLRKQVCSTLKRNGSRKFGTLTRQRRTFFGVQLLRIHFRNYKNYSLINKYQKSKSPFLNLKFNTIQNYGLFHSSKIFFSGTTSPTESNNSSGSNVIGTVSNTTNGENEVSKEEQQDGENQQDDTNYVVDPDNFPENDGPPGPLALNVEELVDYSTLTPYNFRSIDTGDKGEEADNGEVFRVWESTNSIDKYQIHAHITRKGVEFSAYLIDATIMNGRQRLDVEKFVATNWYTPIPPELDENGNPKRGILGQALEVARHENDQDADQNWNIAMIPAKERRVEVKKTQQKSNVQAKLVGMFTIIVVAYLLGKDAILAICLMLLAAMIGIAAAIDYRLTKAGWKRGI